MITTNAHRVEKIRLGSTQQLTDTESYTRKFTFISDGNMVELTLFADDPKDLEVTQS